MNLCGRILSAGEYINIPPDDTACLIGENKVFVGIANGDIVINNGSDDIGDIAEPTEAWRWLIGDTMPYSRHLEGKLAVHASSKPEPAGSETFAVWSGCGDDITKAGTADSLFNGEILTFNMDYKPQGPHDVIKDVWFDPYHGKVWIHEAYLKFEGGGVPDCFDAYIMAPGTPVQNMANLDLLVDDDGYITYSPGGPGTGTHGFAGVPSLLPRSFSKDGDWDFDGTNLLPNFEGTGEYRININEMAIHRYFINIPLMGSSTTYFTMSSDETATLRNDLGHFIRIVVHNRSNSDWSMSCIMEIFRERTVDP